MISPTPSRSPNDSATVEPGVDYLASEAHYLSLAGRVSAALRDGRLVIVTGDPLPSWRGICDALAKATKGRHAVIEISCGHGLDIEELNRTGSAVGTQSAPGGAAVTPVGKVAEAPSPLFVFEEIDRLSDQQIDQISEAVAQRAEEGAAGVLLASPGLLARLNEPSLISLKEALVARFRLDEIGEDEAMDFLRHQLQTRHREDEARGIPPIVFRGLAVLGVATAIGIAAFFAVNHLRLAGQLPTGTATGDYSAGAPPRAASQPSAPDPPATPAAAPSAAPAATSSRPALAAAPSTPGPPAAPSTLAPDPKPPQPASPAASLPSFPQSTSGEHLPPQEVAALVARGDAFLREGDIASARLFYERAADAGNGSAALRLGATFDSTFLSRAGVRGMPGDPARAASWYRRALYLGEATAAERLNNLDQTAH